jgi:hypothetical protein
MNHSRAALVAAGGRLNAAFHNFTHESVHPEPVEGWPSRSWFDKLTTNGYVTVIVKRTT